jgi:hypothetical protein
MKRALLRVEQLESRQMPAVIVWGGGGADNLWSNGANWVGGVAPGLFDDAVFNNTSIKDSTVDAAAAPIVSELIIQAGYTGKVTLNENLSVLFSVSQADPNSTIVIPATFTLSTPNFSVTAGTTGGNGSLSINGVNANNRGSLNWGGTFNNHLLVSVGQFADITIASNVTLDQSELDAYGTTA